MIKRSIGFEIINPTKAEALLERFQLNRPSNPRRVSAYAKLMSEGKWGPLSMIITDENGNTVDGHHRLEAVIKSGMSVEMIVLRGIERKYIPFIDTGRSRSAGDMLAFLDSLDSIGSLRNIAGIARAILLYDKKDYGALLSYDEIASFVVANKIALKDAYAEYSGLRKIGGRLQLASALYVIRRENPNRIAEVDLLARQIIGGENISAGMPAYAARNAILASRNNGGRSSWLEPFYIIFKAWHATANKESMTIIRPSAATLDNVLKINISE